MPGSAFHDLEDVVDEALRYLLVEQVAHRIDEDPPWLSPAERSVEKVGLKGGSKALAIPGLAHGLKTFRHSFGVAELAARAHLGASGYRVPGGVGPFDGRRLGHS